MTYEERLKQLTEQNPDIVILTAENRGAMRGLAPLLGDRFVDVGIAEQTLVGAAAGLALRGRIPLVHAFSAFLTMRAFEFIRTDVGVGRLPVKLIGAASGFLSEANGPTHQALEDIALMRGIPGMQVVCPADADELVEALPSIVDSQEPCYVRYVGFGPAVRHTARFEFGTAEVIRGGEDVTILSYGFLLREAARAAELLEAERISVRVLNLRSLQPLDKAAILQSVSETRLLVTLEDHFLTGGLFSIVSELLARNRAACNVLPVALENRWFKPALLDEALQYEGFTAPQLAERIVKRYREL
ncbi:MAG TPA: transketolase C-terminal domain-containing protein [Acidobacteriota bacterium]|nr:transketolase C-terminal domain-containing protein [Acidobacteriota bacterium]